MPVSVSGRGDWLLVGRKADAGLTDVIGLGDPFHALPRGGRRGVNPYRRWTIALICATFALIANAATPLEWSRTIEMPDGRTFVSDGAISVDTDVAQPATLPSIVIPQSNSRPIADMMAKPYTNEIDLGDLEEGERANSFVTPDGIRLNGIHVDFLRRTVPGARLRTTGNRDPVIIMMKNRAVGIVMPLAPPARPQ